MGFWQSLKEKFTKMQPPPPAQLPGRNEPCWCGSEKKYKHCHYESDKARIRRELAAARSCTTKG